MPRSRPIDYPQVHPPTAQIYQGLAPPPNAFADPNRFSWQNSSNDLVSPSHVVEQELEAGISGQDQERRTSTVPPLPILPDHLGGIEQQDDRYQTFKEEKATQSLPPDNQVHSPARTEVAQQYYQQISQPQAYLSHSNTSGLVEQQQQNQANLNRQPSGPPLSYEASQAQIASQLPLDPRRKMQEQTTYSGHFDGSGQQYTDRALPLNTSYHSTPINHVESSDRKPANQSQPEHIAQQVPSIQLHRPEQHITTTAVQQRSAPIYIGPDVHPLSPTSPTITSPFHTTRTQPFPSTDPSSNQYPAFPQATSFNPPSPRRSGGTWQTSLFSCSNPSICLPALACPCIIYGRTQYRLSQKSANKDPTNMLGYSAVNGSCIAWSVLCGFNVLLTAIQHTRIRKKYEMQEGSGNVTGDCVKSLCCCCCIIALDEKEVKMREEGKMSGKENMIERAYTSPGSMVYSPPPRGG